ncbi:TetR family transcriptional regulator [soil metagenome]
MHTAVPSTFQKTGTADKLGLRDKKRIETRARLERAAVELVVRDGLALATIDAISDAADVSSRTFFNYFDSKEDAILGLRDVDLSGEVATDLLARYESADIVERVVRLLFVVIGPSIADSDLHAARMKIVQQHPELLSRHVTLMMRMADQITAAIETLLQADPAFAAVEPEADATASAELLLALCGGGVRVAVKRWIAEGSTTPAELLEAQAISLIREVTKKIT